MKYIDEFRKKHLIDKVSAEIRRSMDRATYRFMDVCGTHTMNIFRFGLKDLLPKNIKLISGPGCPVCVTHNSFIDKAIAIANLENVIIATFGDMLRVPGSYSSLEMERANGNSIVTVYSAMDALIIAKKNPKKHIVFLGIGFETTTPTVAASLLSARKKGIKNYYVLCGHKTMPEILKTLAGAKDIKIDGFLLPGHVSTIIGPRPYEFLSVKYKKRCVIAGFEPLDIMQAVLMLINQDPPKVDVQYTRAIRRDGNPLARYTVQKVFEKADSEWRGIGLVRQSGLRIRDEFSSFDAESKFKPKIRSARDNRGCICGEVLKGIKTPLQCTLFGRVCDPERPVGACMVSSEGACAAYYKYNRVKG